MHDEEDTLYAERSQPDPEVMRGPRVVAAVEERLVVVLATAEALDEQLW